MPALTLPLGSPFSVGDVVLPGCSIAQPLPILFRQERREEGTSKVAQLHWSRWQQSQMRAIRRACEHDSFAGVEDGCKAAKSQFPVMKLRRFRTAGDQEQKQKQKTADIVFAQKLGMAKIGQGPAAGTLGIVMQVCEVRSGKLW